MSDVDLVLVLVLLAIGMWSVSGQGREECIARGVGLKRAVTLLAIAMDAGEKESGPVRASLTSNITAFPSPQRTSVGTSTQDVLTLQ
jgi:hypothetical protein